MKKERKTREPLVHITKRATIPLWKAILVRVVAILIAGAVVVGTRLVASIDVVGNRVGVGAQLHRAIGVAGTGEGVSHAVGANENVDIGGVGLRRDNVGFVLSLRCKGEGGEKDEEKGCSFHWVWGLRIVRKKGELMIGKLG